MLNGTRNASDNIWELEERIKKDKKHPGVMIELSKVFHASMLIRHSNNGKMYLYNIIDIKKETRNSLGE